MDLQSLFPTPIGFFTFDPGLTDEEREFIINQPQRPNMGNTSSQNVHLLEQPELSRLAEFARASVDEYLRTVYVPKHEVELRITQSWSNNTKTGQFHHKHEHPNSFVSGVFYVDSDPASDKIFFYRSGYQQVKLPPGDWNAFNSDSWWFEAVPNRLILFPSHLTHMVQTIEQADHLRCSMSFNTFPVGIVGDEMELTELVLQ